MRSSDIWKGLVVEPLALHNERRQFGCFHTSSGGGLGQIQLEGSLEVDLDGWMDGWMDGSARLNQFVLLNSNFVSV